MFVFKCLLINLFYILTLQSTYTYAQNKDAVIIDLATYNASVEDAQIFKTTTILNDTHVRTITLNHVNPLIKYFIVQIHSFQREVVISNTSMYSTGTFVIGTNIGLTQIVKSTNYSFYIKNEVPVTNNSVFIAIVAHHVEAPLPGGCNMEFWVETAPYEQLQYSNSIITIDTAPASMNGYSCEGQVVKHDMYHMYLPERDYSPESYFQGVQKMILVEDILQYGSQVFKPFGSNILKKLYAAYPGTGSIYVMVATFRNASAAYVPIATYACDALHPADSCEAPNSIGLNILCFIVFFVGIFMCYFGSVFSRANVFIIGTLLGGFFSYEILVASAGVNYALILIGIGISYIIFGLLIVCFCGHLSTSVSFMLLVLGFIVSSIVFFTNLGDMLLFTNFINYWGVFLAICIFCVLLFLGVIGSIRIANILSCSIIGSYIAIIPIDYYIGSNLKYIFINTVRRMMVANFEYAVIAPPYQFKDTILTVIWIGLAASGFIVQLKLFRVTPSTPSFSSEETPLLIPFSHYDYNDGTHYP